jgi:hypothetical protein
MTAKWLIRIIKALIRRVYWLIQRTFLPFGISILFLDPINFKQLRISRFTTNENLIAFFKQLRPIRNGYNLVRVGSNTDGGYLVPNDFDGISHCYSAGCDKKWTFELELEKSFGIYSRIIDSEDKRPNDLTPKHIYTPKWLGSKSTKSTLTMDHWVSLTSSEGDAEYILQMDIEGYEWLTLIDLNLDFLLKFRILVIEFHGSRNLINRKHFDETFKPMIDQLVKYFDPVHIHGNNCCGLVTYGQFVFPEVFELTLHRKDRLKSNEGYAELPNSLDSKNLPEKHELIVAWPW